MDPSADDVPADDVPGLSGGRMILSVVGTVVVFRLVHAYTDTLGTAITGGREGAVTLLGVALIGLKYAIHRRDARPAGRAGRTGLWPGPVPSDNGVAGVTGWQQRR